MLGSRMDKQRLREIKLDSIFDKIRIYYPELEIKYNWYAPEKVMIHARYKEFFRSQSVWFLLSPELYAPDMYYGALVIWNWLHEEMPRDNHTTISEL